MSDKRAYRIYYAPPGAFATNILGVFVNTPEGIKRLTERFTKRDHCINGTGLVWTFEECYPDEIGYPTDRSDLTNPFEVSL